jgi:hypothetical protein
MSRVPQQHYSSALPSMDSPRISDKLGNVSLYSETNLHQLTQRCTSYPARISDILSNELVLIAVASYLSVPSLLNLSSTSKAIREMMHSTPGVWRRIDLAGTPPSPKLEIKLLKFLRQPFVTRDCRLLILDGLPIDNEFLSNILLREMVYLRFISISFCPELNVPQLIDLISFLRRPSAPRPLSLRHISLAGDPLFPWAQPSSFAPLLVNAAGSEIQTDLHSLQCLGSTHIESDRLHRRWHLKLFFPGNPCSICRKSQQVCMKCHYKQSCVGCNTFYCDECEPYPNVHLQTPSLHFKHAYLIEVKVGLSRMWTAL